MLPKASLSVSEVPVYLSGPLNSSAIIYKHASACFHSLPPTPESFVTAKHLMPAAAWLSEANKIAKGEQKKGACSIEDLHELGVRHPIAVLEYWNSWTAVNDARHLWESSYQWLLDLEQENIPVLGLTQQVRELLDELPCRGQANVDGLGSVDISSLAAILSNRWVNDDIMNLSMLHLRRCIAQPGSACQDVHISTSYLYEVIRTTNKNSSIYQSVKHAMTHGGCSYLLFPVFIKDHWVAYALSKHNRTLLIGQSFCICSKDIG
jgi:hypothetical protein